MKKKVTHFSTIQPKFVFGAFVLLGDCQFVTSPSPRVPLSSDGLLKHIRSQGFVSISRHWHPATPCFSVIGLTWVTKNIFLNSSSKCILGWHQAHPLLGCTNTPYKKKLGRDLKLLFLDIPHPNFYSEFCCISIFHPSNKTCVFPDQRFYRLFLDLFLFP